MFVRRTEELVNLSKAGQVYLNDVFTPLADIPGRSNPRVANFLDTFVPSTKTSIGNPSFLIAAPTE